MKLGVKPKAKRCTYPLYKVPGIEMMQPFLYYLIVGRYHDDYDLTMTVPESCPQCLPDHHWIGSTQGPRLGLYDFELA
jgi:hypothetical protein